MKVPYEKDLASHLAPESCAGRRKASGEALTGERADQVSSCEIRSSGVPTSLSEAEGNTVGGVQRELPFGPTQSETLSMCGSSLYGTREAPRAPIPDGEMGRLGKAEGRTLNMYAGGESDERIVPMKRPNKGVNTSAEVVEGSRSTKGNVFLPAAPRTQSRTRASIRLEGVREAARRDRRAQFTALLHHITVDFLRESFYALRRDAAPGVDGVMWQEYEVNLEARLRDLHVRVHRGSYRAQPSRRSAIPKPDGRRRYLGIAALEDKIVQQAVLNILQPIYEVDFKGFSYGFRPGRNQHDALDALWMGITKKKVNWVLDADIRGFFDTIVHEWQLKFLKHRIADRRILRLIRKWLKAGVIEDGKRSLAEVGTPQGSVISPLLGNIYLHYVFDLWVQQWRKKQARGDMIVVRYADDTVLGFQHRAEAERFLKELKERLETFGLSLNPDKTRLLEFGRFATEKRRRRKQGKPETFEFLGFTHISGRTRTTRRFFVKRLTSTQRCAAKLRDVRETLHRRRHEPIPVLGSWLASVVRGYNLYHAVPGNSSALETFRREAVRSWLHALRRRSQRHRMTWARFRKIVDRWIPKPKILHPHPNVRFYAKYPK